MSVRRADQEDQPSTSAIPPTLFRLPDLDRPSTDPETESAQDISGSAREISDEDISDEGAPNRTGDPGSNKGFDSNENSRFDGNHVKTVAETAIASDVAAETQASRSDSPAADSDPDDVAPGDPPAGLGWMETFGSNRSIAVMLVLVFIAAWWTSPKFDSANDSRSDGFANSETALEWESDETANAISEGSLNLDLGEPESFVTSPTISSGPEVSVAMGTPEPFANFDADLFADGNSTSTAQAPPTIPAPTTPTTPTPPTTPDLPSLPNSQIEARVVATPTSQNVLGHLEKMAHHRDFDLNPDVSATMTANGVSTEPASPTPQSTESPLAVDWSRYLPENR